MTETIGNVKINTDDYPGTDLYSDGAVEDELLEIAMNTEPSGFDREIAARKSWPVMYHFSRLRENILSWYPFEGHEKVLEIGSGCGAVTGAVLGRTASVTCVDLSRKRSLVNAYRHRDAKGLEIRLGNFQDVEKKLDRDYDIITLIGVFEYANSYIASEEPYAEFLRIVGRHLKKGGKLLIAIENRLGIKYFAGCREDHTGRWFDGIEGYGENTYARTFVRPELEELFREAGFDRFRFFYPYPDYKFPMSIYSDDYLPKTGELRQNLENFDRSRMMLFDEARALDSIIKAGLFPLFSNSYFIELER